MFYNFAGFCQSLSLNFEEDTCLKMVKESGVHGLWWITTPLFIIYFIHQEDALKFREKIKTEKRK